MHAGFFFECDFKDGGEQFRLQVDVIQAADFNHYYRCRITPGEHNLAVNEQGRLYEYISFIEEFDLAKTNNGKWIDLENGETDVAETIGRVIEEHAGRSH